MANYIQEPLYFNYSILEQRIDDIIQSPKKNEKLIDEISPVLIWDDLFCTAAEVLKTTDHKKTLTLLCVNEICPLQRQSYCLEAYNQLPYSNHQTRKEILRLDLIKDIECYSAVLPGGRYRNWTGNEDDLDFSNPFLARNFLWAHYDLLFFENYTPDPKLKVPEIALICFYSGVIINKTQNASQIAEKFGYSNKTSGSGLYQDYTEYIREDIRVTLNSKKYLTNVKKYFEDRGDFEYAEKVKNDLAKI